MDGVTWVDLAAPFVLFALLFSDSRRRYVFGLGGRSGQQISITARDNQAPRHDEHRRLHLRCRGRQTGNRTHLGLLFSNLLLKLFEAPSLGLDV